MDESFLFMCRISGSIVNIILWLIFSVSPERWVWIYKAVRWNAVWETRWGCRLNSGFFSRSIRCDRFTVNLCVNNGYFVLEILFSRFFPLYFYYKKNEWLKWKRKMFPMVIHFYDSFIFSHFLSEFDHANLKEYNYYFLAVLHLSHTIKEMAK